MTKKIKILNLTKPPEYLQKELDSIHSLKLKLLRDSDWTQTLDAPLSTVNALQWRYWRAMVRRIEITLETLEHSRTMLIELEKNKPESKKSDDSQLVFTKFNFTSIDTFRDSCIMIIKELPQFDEKHIKKFKQKTKNITDFDEIFQIFIGIL